VAFCSDKICAFAAMVLNKTRSLAVLCATPEELTSFWKAASVEDLERYVGGLISSATELEIECDEVFRAHQSHKTKRVTIKDMTCITSRLAERLRCQDPETVGQLTAVLSGLRKACARASSIGEDEFRAYLCTVLAHVWSRLRVQSAGLQTGQPVRLRMQSEDKFCARSMEVEWENGSGQRQSWSSCDDQILNGWYEAEKVLPSSVTDIKVQFKVWAVLTSNSDVCKVDRKCDCAWVTDSSTGQRMPEVLWLRAGQSNLTEPIDVVFQLSGASPVCHVARAWNAARVDAPEDWEHWERKSRPRMEFRLTTLKAADDAAPPNAGTGDPISYLPVDKSV